MYDFIYESSASIADAVQRLKADGDAKLMSGGMTLLPTMKLRLASPSRLIDLMQIAELRGITMSENSVRVGATSRHSEVGESQLLSDTIPALCAVANGIGDAQVRNRGTLGGSIANNDPAADYPAAVLGLDAVVFTDRRQIAADDFFTEMFETALADDEIITAVEFAIPKSAVYLKFPNPASRYAIVGVFVARYDSAVRVAITGAAPCVYRFTDAELALEKSFDPAVISGIEIGRDDLNEDLHASAEYRANLVSVLTERAVSLLV